MKLGCWDKHWFLRARQTQSLQKRSAANVVTFENLDKVSLVKTLVSETRHCSSEEWMRFNITCNMVAGARHCIVWSLITNFE